MATDPSFEIEFLERVFRRLPGDAVVIERLAELYTRAGRYEDGLRLDRRLVRRQPENPSALYNLACSQALTGRHTAALRSLRRAIACGYDDFGWMVEDPDLADLRSRRSFTQFLRELALEEAVG